jgi:ABC-type polar amino acid transport system ATPase subunit
MIEALPERLDRYYDDSHILKTATLLRSGVVRVCGRSAVGRGTIIRFG